MTTNKEVATPAKQNNLPAIKNSDIVNNVLHRVNEFQAVGELKMPKDYVPANALKSAYLILQETTDRDGKCVLDTCSQASIANALLNMVVQGLSPMKRQCSFIAYGGKLSMQREYAGTVALAKRFGGVKDVIANVIYENDVFEYEKNAQTGRTRVIKHEQKFENIDVNKIRGAYATLIFDDGSTNTEVMTIVQIRQAWQQGAAKGNSPAHRNFPDQMCIKTVINRACKLHISTSDDSGVFDDDEIAENTRIEHSKQVVRENANKTELSFTDHQEVTDTQMLPEAKPEVNQATAAPVAQELAFDNTGNPPF